MTTHDTILFNNDMQQTRFHLAAADGHQIETFRWQGARPIIGAVQVAHGMAEHARRYRHLAAALSAQGYVIYANEHRGHGHSAQELNSLGNFGPCGFAAVPQDMAQLSRHIRQEHPDIPLILLGHSMGSFAAQLYMLDYANLVDGIALSGTAALDLLDFRVSGWTLGAANAGIDKPRTPVDWLSRDPVVPSTYIADPLCGFPFTIASAVSIFVEGERTTDMTQLQRIPKDLPLYLFTGDHDPVNANLAWFHPLVERLRSLDLKDVSTHVYGGARHEVLNETNRAEVIANLFAWIHRVASARR